MMTPRTPQNTKKEASREAAKYSPAYTVCRNELEPCTTAEWAYERYLVSSHKPQSLQQRPKVIRRRIRSHRTSLLLFLALGNRSIRTCDITFRMLMIVAPFPHGWIIVFLIRCLEHRPQQVRD